MGIGGNLGFSDKNIEIQPSEPVCTLYPAWNDDIAKRIQPKIKNKKLRTFTGYFRS